MTQQAIAVPLSTLLRLLDHAPPELASSIAAQFRLHLFGIGYCTICSGYRHYHQHQQDSSCPNSNVT